MKTIEDLEKEMRALCNEGEELSHRQEQISKRLAQIKRHLDILWSRKFKINSYVLAKDLSGADWGIFRVTGHRSRGTIAVKGICTFTEKRLSTPNIWSAHLLTKLSRREALFLKRVKGIPLGRRR